MAIHAKKDAWNAAVMKPIVKPYVPNVMPPHRVTKAVSNGAEMKPLAPKLAASANVYRQDKAPVITIFKRCTKRASRPEAALKNAENKQHKQLLGTMTKEVPMTVLIAQLKMHTTRVLKLAAVKRTAESEPPQPHRSKAV